MIVSLHVPKCAGSSLREALASAFGEDEVFLDYGQNPGNPRSEASVDPDGHVARFQRDELPAICNRRLFHGHFQVAKYAPLLGRARFITVLRHPVERTMSHYRYWKQAGVRATDHPIRRYMLERNLSPTEFASIPAIRHFYNRTYFGLFDIKVFDFVGAVESMGETASALSEVVGRPLALGHLRQTHPTEPLSPLQRWEMERILSADIQFYETALRGHARLGSAP